MTRRTRDRLLAALLAAGLLVLGACGSGDDGGDADAATAGQVDESQSDVNGEESASGDASSDECSLGVAGNVSMCADSLIDELAVVPLPDFVDEIGLGGEPNSSDARAFQDVYFNVPVSEVVAFYEEALPAAGFDVTSAEGNDSIFTYEFTDPDGRTGQLLIRSAASHLSQMGIQIRASD